MDTKISPTAYAKALKLLKKTFGERIPDICIMTGTAGPYFPETEGLNFVTFGELNFGFVGQTKGHERKIYAFELFGKVICLVAGRIHYNEGNTADQVAAIPRLIANWGCRNFIFTNASGSLDSRYQPGENIVITDYHNGLPDPMIGTIENDFYGSRFFARHDPFTLQGVLRESLAKHRNNSQHTDIGTFAAISGPGFESEMTARWYSLLANLVGMSTTIELDALLALDHYLRNKEESDNRIVNIGVITYITNYTLAVDGSKSVSHEDNLEMMKKNEEKLRKILLDTVRAIKTEKVGKKKVEKSVA